MDLHRGPVGWAAPDLEVELHKVIPHLGRGGGVGSAAGAAELMSSADADCPAFIFKKGTVRPIGSGIQCEGSPGGADEQD